MQKNHHVSQTSDCRKLTLEIHVCNKQNHQHREQNVTMTFKVSGQGLGATLDLDFEQTIYPDPPPPESLQYHL